MRLTYNNKKSIKITLLEKTRIIFSKSNITICGPLGKVFYSSFFDKCKYNLIVHKDFIMIAISDQAIVKVVHLSKLYNLIQNLMFGVHFFFSKKLFFVGIGVRVWIKTIDKTRNVLMIKIGFSQDLYITIPNNLVIFSIKPAVVLIRGLQKEKVNQFSNFIRSYKIPDRYKGKGILYKDEAISLKPGKKN